MSVFDGATVCVTGVSGSFGEAFVTHALSRLPIKAIRGISRSEIKQAELRARLPDPRLRLMIGDVRDQARLVTAFHGADIVIHAAALKRVDAAAYDPGESIRTNVLGALNVEEAARTCGVKRVLGISTDKSAGGANLYAATKACMEHFFAFANHYSGSGPTRLACSRWGNVIGSTGSVLRIWQAQIDRGEPLYVTDPRMSRFLLTLQDAVTFAIWCVEAMQGGEVFIPGMKRARLTDLAEAFAPGYPIRYGSIRPGGEKLAEDIITPTEARRTYERRSEDYCIEPDIHDWDGDRQPHGTLVPEGFSLTSDTPPLAGVAELRALLQDAGVLSVEKVAA